MRTSLTRSLATAAVIGLTAAACGSGGSDGEAADASSSFVEQGAGQAAEIPVETSSPTEEGAGGAAEAEGVEPTSVTLPQNEDDTPAVASMFEALAIFRTCLEDEGYEFIGRPDPEAEATDPVNDSGYLEALGKCAAVSQIVEAMTAMQEESSNLDTEGIEERNRQLVFWTDCMEGRGWTIGGVTTDERGLNTPSDMQGPDGASFLDSDDLGECATVAGEEYEASLEEGS